ncbi:MAG: MBL fold metallo-hydrolase [Bacilli bacterium]
MDKGTLFNDKIHTIYQLNTNTYRIDEASIANCYLLLGENKALLIDSGLGVGDLYGTIRSITNLPITLVLTHNHCDHSGGRFAFKEYYFAREDNKLCYNFLSSKLACKILLKSRKMTNLKLSKRKYHPNKILIDDNYIFDLGNRKIKCLNYPGHTEGSIVLIDESNKYIFTGDNLCPWLWLQLPGCKDLSTWINSANEILKISKGYNIFSGHGDGVILVKNVETLLDEAHEILKLGKKHFKKHIVIYPNKDLYNGINISVKRSNIK